MGDYSPDISVLETGRNVKKIIVFYFKKFKKKKKENLCKQ